MSRVTAVTMAERYLRQGLRALREDLLTLDRDPLLSPSRPGWLRALLYLPFVYAAAALGAAALGNLSDTFGASPVGSRLLQALIVLQAAALVLVVSRPVAGWWLITGAAVAQALAVQGVRDDTFWPWPVWSLVLEVLVLILVAVRVRTRATLTMLAITVGCTLLLPYVRTPAGAEQRLDAIAVVVFALAVFFSAPLRGLRQARTQLIEQATLTAEERARRTLLEERSRIARELHDVVAHHMSVISIQAQVAPHLVENPSDELKENLAGIRNNAVEALTELRRVLGVLRSEQGEQSPDTPQPTLDRLDTLLDNARSAGLTVTAQLDGTRRPLPPGVELSAFRIVQEALSNAMRHAPATEVQVEVVRVGRQTLRIRVLNSRPGLPVTPSPGAGLGLLGMRERTAMLGGELFAGPTPTGGYEVTALLPLN
ncbi:sensor histidine kinase [Streptomyces luteolus]|uniref:histidine kinase n=1 Tax=Streptomyces luteolus TaxID=3043615 RepID=A0ABT6SXL8_9ACTN|nr:sensor histidine kinase [Streptomyces sp. B-S-A12]MDI3420336.1 sensor histidine kinase [Streptomyces sp. B-S-A12]